VGTLFGNRAAKRAVHLPIAATQLFQIGRNAWKDQPVFRTFARAFAVNGRELATTIFLIGRCFLANDFQHLCGGREFTCTYFAISGM